MGSKTATNPSAQSKALVEHMRDSLLPGDTPFDSAHMKNAADFLTAAAQQRPLGEVAIRLETVTEGHRHTRIAIINDDMLSSQNITCKALGLTALLSLCREGIVSPLTLVQPLAKWCVRVNIYYFKRAAVIFN